MINSDAVEAVAFFGSVAATAWAAAFAWAKWLAHRFDGPTRMAGQLPLGDTVDRLKELETALDGVTLEVERLAEGQRYTVRLLEERLPRALPAPPRPAAPDPGRVITPH